MTNCLICHKNPADKKGSHIVPHFLSKRIDNDEGETGRDKEMGFIITPHQTTSYFGRAILPEKLEEIYGEVTDELIENNRVNGIVDNYFCTSCESNLSVIESFYSQTISQNPGYDLAYESTEQGFTAFLFWVSIIWRISIHENSGFKLKPKEKKLNRILKQYLKSNVVEIELNPLDSDLKDIGYKLLRSPHYSDKNWTWLHWQANYKRPYSLMIDEYILFFYTKSTHLKGMVLDFFGSENYKQKAKFNLPTENESIYSVPHEEYSKIVTKINNYGAEVLIKELDITLDIIHQRLGGKGKMNEKLKLEIKKKIVESEVALGKKYTLENQAEIINEVLSKYVKT